MNKLESVVKRMEKLEAHSHRLEKQNRRMKLVGVTGLLGVAAIFLMGQDQIPSARFDTVRARAFVIDDGGGEKATFNADGLTYWEDQQPVAKLSKNHLSLGAIALSVTEAGDAFINIGRAPNQRIEMRSSSLGTDIKVGDQTVPGLPSAASTSIVVGTEVPQVVVSPQDAPTPSAQQMSSPRYFEVTAGRVYSSSFVLVDNYGRPVAFIREDGVHNIADERYNTGIPNVAPHW